MSTTTGEDLARVTVISPTRRIDLALPGGTTLGELLPNIIRFSGYESGTANEAVHTWVLQRFGEDPLDPTKLVSSLNIRDGETLHLRQRDASMPDAAFDDVVDAVATATTTQPAWQPRHSRRVALLVLAALVVGIPALLLLSLPSLASAVIALTVSVGLGITAILLSRAFDKAQVAAAMAWMAVALAGLGGFFLLPAALPIALLTAAAVVLVVAGAMALGAQVHTYQFMAVAVTALVFVVVTMIIVLTTGKAVAVSAVGLVLVLAVTPLLPSLCFALAQVAMPNLPTTSEQLMADDEPVQADIVVRAVTADKLLSALLLATAIVSVVLAIPVILDGHWSNLALTGAAGLALMLRARAFVGLSQRLSLLIAGILISFATLGYWAWTSEPSITRTAIATGILVLAAMLLGVYAASMYNVIVSPQWGRFGDIFEWLALLAMVPLLLQVLNLYMWAYGLSG
ncbi:MAG: type VII secretion integral membrane protein EccD [Propionibacterium sp.]|nr:type VII secretion integral membrane protein EccD [Propionibacterium sp.]